MTDERKLSVLQGSFELDQMRAEAQAFADELQQAELHSRQVSYYWIGAGTLITLLLCGGIVWVLVRKQTSKIRQLKIQAEKLREADFGEPLPESRGDALGELAAVFNDMRDRLRTTTVSPRLC